MQLSKVQHTTIMAILVLVAAILLAGIAYVILNSSMILTKNPPTEGPINMSNDLISLQEVTPEEMNLTGKVYFNDDNDENRRSYLRMYNIESKEMTDVPVAEDGYDQNPILSTSANNRELIYLHTTFDGNTKYDFPYSNERKIVSTNLATLETHDISTSNVARRRQLAVSSSKNIATVGVGPGFVGDPYIDPVTLDDYSIYLIENGGEEKEIGSGFWPSWSTDGFRLYFIRNDGIYRYELNTGNIDFLFGSEKWSLDFTKPGIVSPNEQFFVGYDPDLREIYLYRITSNLPFKMQYDSTYKTMGDEQLFTPSFSNDGTKLFYTSIPDSWNVASVVVVDLLTKKQTRLFSVPIEEKIALFQQYVSK